MIISTCLKQVCSAVLNVQMARQCALQYLNTMYCQHPPQQLGLTLNPFSMAPYGNVHVQLCFMFQRKFHVFSPI